MPSLSSPAMRSTLKAVVAATLATANGNLHPGKLLVKLQLRVRQRTVGDVEGVLCCRGAKKAGGSVTGCILMPVVRDVKA